MAKRWQIVVEGLGVAFPSPATLQQDLLRSAGGSIKVENLNDFEAHGPNNFYTVEAAENFEAEELERLVDQSIRRYGEKFTYTIKVTPAKDR
jgi:hypothetical protein